MGKQTSTAITARRLLVLAVVGVLAIGVAVALAIAASPPKPADAASKKPAEQSSGTSAAQSLGTAAAQSPGTPSGVASSGSADGSSGTAAVQTSTSPAEPQSSKLGVAATQPAPPVAPTLTSKPSDPSTTTDATFAWTHPEAGVTFLCKLDGGAWTACATPKQYTVDERKQHEFGVRAVNGAGATSASAEWKWKLELDDKKAFAIAGALTASLHPGVWRQVALTLTNPNNSTVYVTSLRLAVADAPGCPAAQNIEILQPDVDASTAKRIAVPANGSATVPVSRRPQIRLKDLPNVNQDACKGKSFALSYAGEATK